MEKKYLFVKIAVPVVLVAVLLGVGTGYVLSLQVLKKGGIGGPAVPGQTATQDQSLQVGQVFGNPDEKTFKDKVEGVLVSGGVSGEGSHHIVREGGESQNVYLTSSVLDLARFENHRVVLWGETFRAQKAGWLMDVGRLQILELNATLPDWAQKALQKAEKNGSQN